MDSSVVGDLLDALLKGDTDASKLLRIEVFMILILLVFLVLAFLGSSRRVSRSSAVQVPLWLAYASSYPLLFYTVGLMNSAPFQQDVFAIWAIVVLYALDSTDSISAFTLEDNETVYRSLWDTFIAVLYVGMVVAAQYRRSNLKVQIWTLYGACMARTGIKISARYLASKASVLKLSTKVVADFMSYEHELELNQNNAACSDEFMAGYHYIVKGDDESFALLRQPDYKYRLDLDQDKVVTVSNIWSCDGPLLASKPAGDRLKDLCLSFAMFKLLRRRFAGYPLHEVESERGKVKTWEFVHRGLLSGAGGVERAFRVVEEELAFVFDFFYTKYAAMLDRGFPVLKIGAELLTFAYSIWIAVELRNDQELRTGNEDRVSSVEGSRVDIDVLVTRVVLYSWAVAQFFQIYALLTSNWLKVWLVCKYVRGRRLRKPIEWSVRYIRWLRNFRPWSNKIGQHDILTSTFQSNKGLWNFAMSQLRGVVPETTVVRFPDEVKTAVLEQLMKSHGPGPLVFGGGEPRLQPFTWAISKLETATHSILVWHIATSLCKRRSSKPQSVVGERHRMVATCLSNYCAYLVAVLPALLPGNPHSTRVIYESAVSDIQELVTNRGISREEGLASELVRLVELDESLVKKGARLWQQLDGSEGFWELLAWVWCEMVLYVAPSGSATSHVENLTKGGELVTHLWALLNHAGIVDRQELFVGEGARKEAA